MVDTMSTRVSRRQAATCCRSFIKSETSFKDLKRMEKRGTVTKLSCKVLTDCDCEMKHLLSKWKNCRKEGTCFLILDKEIVTILRSNDVLGIKDIENAIKSGNSDDITSLKDLKEDSVLGIYKQKRRVLIVSISGNSFVIKDKNNYAFITSVLTNKLKSLHVIERSFQLPIHVHRNRHHVIDQRVLPRRTTKVPPDPQPDLEKEPYDGKQESYPHVLVYPINRAQYENDLHDVKYSIQETDGASSMTSTDSFASNVGPRYKSATPGLLNKTAYSSSTRPSRPTPRYREYENSESRRKTFAETDWSSYPNRPDIKTLVECGFFFTGRFDLVRCFQCGIGLKDWSEEDIVMDEHVRHSGECDYIKEKLTERELSRLKLKLLSEADGSSFQPDASPVYRQDAVVVTSYTGSTKNPATPGAPKNGRNKNETATLPYKVRHPEFQTVESRKATFGYFPHNKQDPKRLSIAGFYYTGSGDICRCFCCDGGMQHWDKGDDPVLEHAKYFPACSYIRQMKGDEWIKTIRNQAGMGNEEAVPSSSSTSQGNNAADCFSKGTEQSKTGGSGKSQSDKVDIYRSKVVQNVLASGFEQKQVKTAVDSLLNRGTKEFTEDDIVNMILDNPGLEIHLGSDASVTDPDEVLQENKMLKEFLICMMCKYEEANILFLPCAHHKVCAHCAENLKKCPFCSEPVSEKIKTFMS